jgi:lysophospholipase L1-like esterase
MRLSFWNMLRMSFLTVLCLSALLVAELTVSPDNPNLQYSGRIDFTDPKAPRFDWPGISILAVLDGTSVTFLLEDGGNDFNLIVDGVFRTNFVTARGKAEYALAGMKKGVHTVLLTKRTEALFGVTIFRGLRIPDNCRVLAPPSMPARRIEFIGASWVCGYGNEGAGLKCPNLRPTENNYLAFGPMACRDLNAEYHIVAYSGRGVVRNYGDPEKKSSEPMPLYFDRILQNDKYLSWDFSRWIPDVVVVNLGVNDYSTEPNPDEDFFVNGYVKFLGRIRSCYPSAPIVCFNDLGWPYYADNVKKAVEMRQKQGDKLISFASYPSFKPEEMGCDYHPKVAGHRVIADVLTKYLRQLMKW